MIAQFQTHEQAQAYADKVHAFLSTFPGYIAEKWCDVGEGNTVAFFPAVEPDSEYEFLTETINEELE